MNRRRNILLVALTLAVAGCGPAGASISTSPTNRASPTTPTPPSAAPVSPLASTPVATPIPTLASTTEAASVAPAGAISIELSVPNANPRFVPDQVTAKAGTAVFFLKNVPGPLGSPDHNMRIGPAIGQLLAATPSIRANEAVTFTVQDLTPGSYVFWCTIKDGNQADHAAEGMVGTLTITP